MKKYLSLSVIFYVIAVILFLYPSTALILKYPSLDMGIIVMSGILTLIGITFGVKSVNTKETNWIGRIIIIIGILMILFSLFLLRMELWPL